MKKILFLLLAIIMTFFFVACNKEVENISPNITEPDVSYQEQPTINPSETGSTDLPDTAEPTDNDERSYLCSINESGNGNFIFHYVSDELVKVEYVAYIKGMPEEIEVKNTVSEYIGVLMVDKTDYYLFEIDMEQDGLKYLKDNFEMFKNLSDTSWSFVEEIMIDFGYSCSENTLN